MTCAWETNESERKQLYDRKPLNGYKNAEFQRSLVLSDLSELKFVRIKKNLIDLTVIIKFVRI